MPAFSILPSTSMNEVWAPLIMMSAMSSRASKRFKRTIAKHIIADIFEQLFLLGDRHDDVFDGQDFSNDVANLFTSNIFLDLRKLGQINGINERIEDRCLDIIIFSRARPTITWRFAVPSLPWAQMPF